jgi:hypothetical protein
MDGTRFDNLAKLVGKGASRRTILKGLLGLGGIAITGTVAGDADARTLGTRPTIPPPPPPPPPTTTTPAPTTTTADPCPLPAFKCGLDCCADELQCCDGECCPDGTVCLTRVFEEGPFVEEETCCPFELTCENRCCNGECIDPALSVNGGNVITAQVDPFDQTCCPAEGAVCPGSNGTFCCQGDTPQCCVRKTGEAVCIAADACCTGADCNAQDDPATCREAFCNDQFACETRTICTDQQPDCCQGGNNTCCRAFGCNTAGVCCGSSIPCADDCCDGINETCCGGDTCCLFSQCNAAGACCPDGTVTCANACCPTPVQFCNDNAVCECTNGGIFCEDVGDCVADAECCVDTDCGTDDACTTFTCVENECRGLVTVCRVDFCTDPTCDPVTGCPTESACAATGETCCPNGECVDLTDPAQCCSSTDCDDGNACTTGVCTNNVCSQFPVICAVDRCTSATCNPSTGCPTVSACAASGQICCLDGVCRASCGCTSDAECNDNNACTNDFCSGPAGQAVCVNSPIICDDGNVCTTSSCDSVTGCTHTPIPGCCTSNEQCAHLTNTATCVQGICSGNACTTQAICTTAGTTCCGDGTCGILNKPIESADFCTASSQCCGDCCIDSDLTFQTLDAICAAAFPPPGFSVQREECAQIIAEMQIFDVCASNQIVTHPGFFPERVSILPCLP